MIPSLSSLFVNNPSRSPTLAERDYSPQDTPTVSTFWISPPKSCPVGVFHNHTTAREYVENPRDSKSSAKVSGHLFFSRGLIFLFLLSMIIISGCSRIPENQNKCDSKYLVLENYYFEGCYQYSKNSMSLAIDCTSNNTWDFNVALETFQTGLDKQELCELVKREYK